MEQAFKGAAKAAEAKVHEPAAGLSFEIEQEIMAKYRELGLPGERGLTEIVIALAERLVSVEKQLAALQRATAHITSIQPIKG